MRPQRIGYPASRMGRPHSWMRLPDCCECSLHMYHGLCTDGRKIGLGAIARANFDQSHAGVSGCYGFEGEVTDASLPVDSTDVGWSGGGDGNETVALVAVDDGYRLTVAG